MASSFNLCTVSVKVSFSSNSLSKKAFLSIAFNREIKHENFDRIILNSEVSQFSFYAYLPTWFNLTSKSSKETTVALQETVMNLFPASNNKVQRIVRLEYLCPGYKKNYQNENVWENESLEKLFSYKIEIYCTFTEEFIQQTKKQFTPSHQGTILYLFALSKSSLVCSSSLMYFCNSSL